MKEVKFLLIVTLQKLENSGISAYGCYQYWKNNGGSVHWMFYYLHLLYVFIRASYLPCSSAQFNRKITEFFFCVTLGCSYSTNGSQLYVEVQNFLGFEGCI